MYKQFYGLTERPFDLTTNPRFLFVSPAHREAISLLQYGLEADKGITVLIGEAGTGKTTLLTSVLAQQRGAQLFTLYMKTPPLTRHELHASICDSIRLGPAAQSSRNIFLREFEQFLRDRRSNSARTTLVIDEAQAVQSEVLEEVRLLANLESPTGKLLSVILAGQPELARRLSDPAMYALKQRVALRSTLRPLDLKETAAYVAKRIRVAGGDAANLLSKEAIKAVYRGSGGIPRTINVICDNALITGYALQARPIDADVIVEVCADFDIPIDGVPPASRPSPSAGEPHLHEPAAAPSAAPAITGLLGTPMPITAAPRSSVAATERPRVEGRESTSDEFARLAARVARGLGSI